jgi:ubiquinone/menaquinone biosynthesis C-methylase UbiE
MAAGERYIPALRFQRLTALYDPVVALTTREGAFKRRVLELAALRDGEDVLDLACGTGTLAIQAKRATPRARVTGVDGDAAVLERAREKARAGGVEVGFHKSLSTQLRYADGSFDCVLSTLFFHHLSDDAKRRTGSEIRRVLRPGGRLVAADWGRAQDPFMRMAFLPVRMLDGFGPTAANASGRLSGLLAEGGLEGVAVADRMRTPLGTIELLTARRG